MRRSWSLTAAASEKSRRAIIAIDTHAHVFTRDLPLAPGRRYAPDYDADIDAYIARLDRYGLDRGVLVQPSFLGTDNSYLIEALAEYPTRLRGIAVVAPDIARTALDDLERAGVVGLRLNLIGEPDPALGSLGWRRHLAAVAERGWQIEIQAEAHRLRWILPPLIDAGVAVVVDHFGKPDPEQGVDDPGFRHLLSLGPSRAVWVKLSGAYRTGDIERGQAIAAAAVPLLKEAFGLDRLVWGSDWPHTQFEAVASYPNALALLGEWLPDAAERAIVLGESAAQLFRF